MGVLPPAQILDGSAARISMQDFLRICEKHYNNAERENKMQNKITILNPENRNITTALSQQQI